MNHLVYLFELDSARKQEPCPGGGVAENEGVRALFREIIQHGNSVAISMNQLTDAPFFAQAVGDAHAYPMLMELFAAGALRVSLYGKFRTVSQYVQSAIARCLSGDQNTYIFSNLPIQADNRPLLNTVYDAIRFSDLGLIRREMENCPEEARADLEYILRFVDMVLKLSTMETGIIPAKVPGGRSFTFFLEKICQLLKAHTFPDEGLQARIQQALENLQRKDPYITEGRNNRSVWLSHQDGAPDLTPEAISLIHLCYNYTVEDSIRGVCKHYEDADFDKSFLEDLTRRLMGAADSQEAVPSPVKPKVWRRAVHFAQYRKDHPLVTCVLQENTLRSNRKWKTLAALRALQSLLWAGFYLGLFFFVELLMDWVQGLWAIQLKHPLVSAVANILVFGLVGTGLGAVLKRMNRGREVPGLFESITDIFQRLGDCCYIIFRRRL